MHDASTHTTRLFGREKAIIGMVHVGALPGTPHATDPVRTIVERAVAEARRLVAGGVDAVMIENMHDRPYLRQAVGPEIVAAMAAIAVAVRGAVKCPLGVQVLGAANREALAVALAGGCAWIRAENFAYAHVADEGLMAEADAGPLLRYRRMIGAGGVAVIADVKKKHASHAITADVDLAEAARTAEFFGAEAIVVTGVATGRETAPDDVRAAAEAVSIPVVVGSGVTPDNLGALWAAADAFIVGSWIKRDGDWRNEPDADRLRALMAARDRLASGGASRSGRARRRR